MQLIQNFILITYWALHYLWLYLSVVEISIYIFYLFGELKALLTFDHEIDLVFVLFRIFRILG